MYINWYYFAAKRWKCGASTTLVRRGHVNCSSEKHLKDELKRMRETLKEINNYPHWVITKIFKEINEMIPLKMEKLVEDAKNTSIKNNLLVLPHQRDKRLHIVSSMKRYVNKVLRDNVKVQTSYTGKRLSSCFKAKDKTNFVHQHDIIYQKQCSENCSDGYIGQSARRIIKRVKDHGRRDAKSHVSKRSILKEHVEVTQKNFEIIGSYFKNNCLKWKVQRYC